MGICLVALGKLLVNVAIFAVSTYILSGIILKGRATRKLGVGLGMGSDTPTPGVNYRLPMDIKPIHYNISLTTYLHDAGRKKFTFRGECFIEFQVLKNTTQIQLHITNLIIMRGIYRKKTGGYPTDLPNATPHSSTDIVVYDLKEELEANEFYIMEYFYDGFMDKEEVGFYRSKYTTSTNVTK